MSLKCWFCLLLFYQRLNVGYHSLNMCYSHIHHKPYLRLFYTIPWKRGHWNAPETTTFWAFLAWKKDAVHSSYSLVKQINLTRFLPPSKNIPPPGNLFLMWSLEWGDIFSAHLLWSIFQSPVTHITHYKSGWTFCVGNQLTGINWIILYPY